MKDNPIFYTASMAKLCAAQSYYDKSLEIYRYLSQNDADHSSWRHMMAEVEAKQAARVQVAAAAETSLDRLAPMIQKWVSLMVERDLKVKFDKIRKNVKQLQSLGQGD